MMNQNETIVAPYELKKGDVVLYDDGNAAYTITTPVILDMHRHEISAGVEWCDGGNAVRIWPMSARMTIRRGGA